MSNNAATEAEKKRFQELLLKKHALERKIEEQERLAQEKKAKKGGAK